jgi:succinate dehydrogenase / fumarate reductase flavoprotein subunit
VSGAVGYWRPSGEFVVFTAKAVVMATGGVGKSWLYTSNSWESTGDGHAMSLWAGADVIDMEFVQFHPTGMVWPLSVRGILVTEGVRGDGGVLRNSDGQRFMFDYIPPMFAAETADSEDEGDKWYDDHTAGRRPPELLPRDEVARSINSEVKAGRGSPHGGVFLDIATRRTAEDIRRRLPSMYHQFKELAGVDITAEAMEVGPPATTSWAGSGWTPTRRPPRWTGCSPPARWPAGCTGPTGSAATRSPTCWCSGGGPASGRRVRLRTRRPGRPSTRARSTSAIDAAVAPFEFEGGENPYDIHHELQATMQSLVGIIRTGSELEEAVGKLDRLEERATRVSLSGGGRYNPGWNLTTDLPAMLTVSRCTTQGAINRKESRGGHTRDDYPKPDAEMGTVNFVERIPRRRGPLAVWAAPRRSGASPSPRADPGDARRSARNCSRRRPDGRGDRRERPTERHRRGGRRDHAHCGAERRVCVARNGRRVRRVRDARPGG